MKKLFFTAIALVVFSSVSMANTIENETSVLTISDTPCADQWSEDVDVLMDGFGATLDEAMIIADRCFEECLDSTYGPN